MGYQTVELRAKVHAVGSLTPLADATRGGGARFFNTNLHYRRDMGTLLHSRKQGVV